MLQWLLRALARHLQSRKIANYGRRLAFGDLVTDRWENARMLGFGDQSSMYDNVLVIGDREHVKVGRQVWIGPNVILDGSGFLTIGDRVSISAGVHIYTHDTVDWALGRDNIDHASTKIGNNVYIGPNSIIAKGVTVGDGAVIGALSFVNSDIPAGARAWGQPAKVVGRSNSSTAVLCPVGYDPP